MVEPYPTLFPLPRAAFFPHRSANTVIAMATIIPARTELPAG